MPYADPQKKKENAHRWWAENRERQAAYRACNKEKRSAQHKEWRKKNLSRRAISMRAWRSNPENRLASNLRSRISNVLKGRTKFFGLVEATGCELPELKAWLSGWFEEGMSWDNYGRWEIDHRHPCDSFDLSDPEQQRRCFHYLNLRPLWKTENRSKGSRHVVQ